MSDEQIFQKRTYELATFIPKLPGEPDYEDPSTIWIPVDRVTWPEAKKMSLVEFISNLHKEQGPVTLDGVEVNEIFESEFTNLNYYLNIQAYRYIVINGVSLLENIPIKNFIKREDGFSLELESYLPNDVLNYLAFE